MFKWEMKNEVRLIRIHKAAYLRDIFKLSLPTFDLFLLLAINVDL